MKAKDLRNSILQLAVQGKLVPQDPNDEPASALLERIRAERAKLIKEKKIKAPKGGESVIYRASDGSHYEKRGNGEPVCIDDEIPFEIPGNWEWARISSVVFFQEGPGVLAKDFRSVGIPLIRIAGMQTSRVTLEGCNYLDPEMVSQKWNHFRLNIGDVLISTSASMDKICLVDDEAEGAIPYTGQIRFKMTSAVLREFFIYFVQAPAYMDQVQSQASGTAIKHYGPTHLRKMVIPIPPIKEQLRITALLDEVMPHVDKYGTLEEAREQLDSELPDRLRKSILQMAVQGELVEQDSNDEPASALIDRICAERAKLIKEKKIKPPKGGGSVIYRASDGGYYEKRGKGEPVCIDEEIPFEIPEGWEWARLGSIVFNRPQIKPFSDFCYIDIGSIDNTRQQLSEEDTVIAADKAPSRARKPVEKGDVLYATVRPYLHNACIINRAFPLPPIASTGFAAMVCATGINNAYLLKLLISPTFDAYANDTENSKGVAYPAINDQKLYSALVPVPPENEQSRIAMRTEELIAAIG